MGKKIRLAVVVTGKRMNCLDDPIDIVRNMQLKSTRVERAEIVNQVGFGTGSHKIRSAVQVGRDGHRGTARLSGATRIPIGGAPLSRCKPSLKFQVRGPIQSRLFLCDRW